LSFDLATPVCFITRRKELHVVHGEIITELRPLTGILVIPQMIHEYGEERWNDTDRGKLKNSEKNLSTVPYYPL
jgi:hypothetical protein